MLYNVPIVQPNQPPIPRRSTPKWDSEHVRMPCSSMSQYPLKKVRTEENIGNISRKEGLSVVSCSPMELLMLSVDGI